MHKSHESRGLYDSFVAIWVFACAGLDIAVGVYYLIELPIKESEATNHEIFLGLFYGIYMNLFGLCGLFAVLGTDCCSVTHFLSSTINSSAFDLKRKFFLI